MEDYEDENSDDDMVSAVVQYLSSNDKSTDEELADPLLGLSILGSPVTYITEPSSHLLTAMTLKHYQ